MVSIIVINAICKNIIHSDYKHNTVFFNYNNFITLLLWPDGIGVLLTALKLSELNVAISKPMA